MPVAIVMSSKGAIPGFYYEATDHQLLCQLRRVSDAPALHNVDAAKSWLRSQPAPSGWFQTAAHAQDHVSQTRKRR